MLWGQRSTGVIWGHMDQRSFSPKMLLLQITWHGYVTHAYIYISLRPSIPFMESRSTGVTSASKYHATVSRSVSRSSSSVNTSLTYISDMSWPILTRLGHKYRLTIPFMSYVQIGVKCHVGVTGVKKVIFTKNATSSTDYVAWSHDLCMW